MLNTDQLAASAPSALPQRASTPGTMRASAAGSMPSHLRTVAVLNTDANLRRWLHAAVQGEQIFRAVDPNEDPALQAHPNDAAVLIWMGLSSTIPIGETPDTQLALIEEAKSWGLPILALSDGGTVTLAVDSMRKGAEDYMMRPASPDRVLERLRSIAPDVGALVIPDQAMPSAAEFSNGPGDITTTSDVAPTDAPQAEKLTEAAMDGFVGTGPAMAQVFEVIRKSAPSKAAAFITGESGTGKELAAQALHQVSGRQARPFVAINCSAVPRDLIESEVFGHRAGAFTGAVRDYAGAAGRANGGTLFLDEICEMDLDLQSKLLRFLQTGAARPVGGDRDIPLDVRIVCATNRDPMAEVQAGRFREDLYYRLHVLPVHLPPLRARQEDIIPLAETFLHRFSAEEQRKFAGFMPAAEALLTGYDWPGNVRQLENTLRRIVVMHDGHLVTPDMIPLALAHSGQATAEAQPSSASVEPVPIKTPSLTTQSFVAVSSKPEIEPFWLQEKRIIESALEAFEGHVGKAAAALDISPSTIYRKKQSWDEMADGDCWVSQDNLVA